MSPSPIELPGPALAVRKPGAVEGETIEDIAGPLVDLSTLRDIARRRRKLWLAMTVAGVVLGAGFHTLVPAKYQALTDLYLVEPSGQGALVGMQDDLSLLETRAVAASAVKSLHLATSPANFLSTYAGTSSSDVILSIKTTAATPGGAIRNDNAVAHAFLLVRSHELRFQTGLQVKGLRVQVNALNAEIKTLTNEINTVSQGQAESQSGNELQSLVAQRSGDTSEISQLQQQLQQDLLNEEATARGSVVLDSAAAIKVSVKKVIAEDALTGLIGGGGLGLGLVIVAGLISDRPRRRAEVAAAVGAPVELSLGRYNPPRVLRRWRLRRRLRKSGPMLQMAARRLRAHLEASRGSVLATVAVGPVDIAALSLLTMARALASEGKGVVIVDMAEGRPLPGLLDIKARPGSSVAIGGSSQGLTLLVANADPAQMNAEAIGSADVVLVLATVDPALGADYLAAFASDAVFFVTAGAASGARLTASSQILRYAGVNVRSVILLGAVPYDDSIGLTDPAELLTRWPARSEHSRRGEEGEAQSEFVLGNRPLAGGGRDRLTEQSEPGFPASPASASLLVWKVP